jgi:hypothetical protein
MAQDTLITFGNDSTTAWKKNAVWKVEQDSQTKVLSLIKRSSSAFNLCYNPKISFLDGSITVKFRANSGRIDQGGGIMWRVQDDDNYYIARFNPLEDNFRFYLLHDGIREEISSANVHLSKGWHSMKITQNGHHFEGFIDGKPYLKATDARLNKSGGVGVWTKADAMTSFDDLNISTSK